MNNSQKELLNKYINTYPEMKIIRNAGARELWEKAAFELNRVGTHKTAEQWMRVCRITIFLLFVFVL